MQCPTVWVPPSHTLPPTEEGGDWVALHVEDGCNRGSAWAQRVVCTNGTSTQKAWQGQDLHWIDLKYLKEATEREKFVLPTLEDIAPELGGSTVFSTLDASSGFWQLLLDPEPPRLTTFLSPFGRFCFKRVPFEITSTLEIYQRTMEHLLEGLPGVKMMMDDILVYGNEYNHESRLRAVLDRIRLSGLKLNQDKCHFKKFKVEYFGHVISKDGVHADPGEVDAIRNLEPWQNVAELRQILGMTNYLGNFLHGLSGNIQPLNKLL